MIISRAFIIGFLSGLLLFGAVNIYTYDDGTQGATGPDGVRMAACFDCPEQIGWPFRFYQSGTFAHVNEFLWPGLLADILMAVFGSAVVGLLCKQLWARGDKTVGGEITRRQPAA
jgi:hypothetical protein